MRPYLFGLFAIILFGLWWYLDTLLATRGWATMAAGGQWTLVSEGWGVMLTAWPLALVGVLIGGIPAFFLVGCAWQYVEDEDHHKEITHLQQQLMAAEVRATQAMAKAITEANRQTQAREQAAEQLKQQAARDIAQASQAAAGLAAKEQEAREAIIVAQTECEQANRKTRNAAAAYQRKANQVAKMQKQTSEPAC